ncbi:MAG: RodZ domain-containing protein [Candidatus Omnitrophota bacterium]
MTKSVGNTLKKIRESKQLSIQEVSERLRIPKKILLAIEEDNIHECSSPFYAKSFVRSYSQFLGASEENIVKEYLKADQKKDRPVLVLEGKGFMGDWFRKYKNYIGLGCLVVFLIGMVFFSFVQARKFVRHVFARHKLYGAKKEQQAIALAESKDLLKGRTLQEDVATRPAKIEGIKLEILARSDTWIKLIGDGELLFTGILRRGTSDIWNCKKEIRLELGNAGGVTMKLNEEAIGPPGRKGEKKKLVITGEGIKNQ